DDTVDADEVDVDLPREALGRDVDGRAGRDQAGVADDDLDVAEVGGRLRGELGHRRVVGDVEGVRDRFATAHADGRGDLLQRVGPARPEGDRVARRGEDLGRLGADPGGGAGDHRGSPVGVPVLL